MDGKYINNNVVNQQQQVIRKWSLKLLTHFLPSKLCTIYSYVHFQTQNNRKIQVNFAKHIQNIWQERDK
jgi:hypothetical protein